MAACIPPTGLYSSPAKGCHQIRVEESAPWASKLPEVYMHTHIYVSITYVLIY